MAPNVSKCPHCGAKPQKEVKTDGGFYRLVWACQSSLNAYRGKTLVSQSTICKAACKKKPDNSYGR